MMKANINIDGLLSIIPESDTEQFALETWFDNYCSQKIGISETQRVSLGICNQQASNIILDHQGEYQMRSFYLEWEEFKKSDIPKKTTDQDVKKIQEAFYSGANIMFLCLMELCDSNLNEEANYQIMKGYKEELNEFMQQLQNDKNL